MTQDIVDDVPPTSTNSTVGPEQGAAVQDNPKSDTQSTILRKQHGPLRTQ